MKRLMPHGGDIVENEPTCGNAQLLDEVIPFFNSITLRFLLPNHPLWGRRDMAESDAKLVTDRPDVLLASKTLANA